MIFSVWTNLRHQQGLYEDYRWRIRTSEDLYMAADPVVQGNSVLFVAMRRDGYQLGVQSEDEAQFSGARPDDILAVSAAPGTRWVEQVGRESTIMADPISGHGESVVRQAESPVASFDGRWLAFLREDRGLGRIWVRGLGQQDHPDSADKPVTPPALNALEMSFLPTGELVFAATSGGKPGLFITDAGSVRALGRGEARYPAVSPDGNWLAYSQLQSGYWNLWLRDLRNGQVQRLTHAECNSMEPVWAEDSKTLVYASDCGRALWFSSLCRRRVIP
jgi:hypothetical protein